jgi:hypothetical protein
MRPSLELLRLKARADYRQWRQEKFEQEIDGLIFRIGTYDRPSGFLVTISEIRETIGHLCKIDDAILSDASLITWMHHRMNRKRET